MVYVAIIAGYAVLVTLVALRLFVRARQLAARLVQSGHSSAELASKFEELQAVLQRRETELRLFTSVLPAGLIYVDRDEVYRFSNATYAKWQHLSVDGIIGKKVKDVVPTEFYQQLQVCLGQLWSGKATAMEGFLPYHDKRRHVRIQMEPEVGDDGKVVGYMAMISDISVHVQIQRELKAAKEAADAANQAKTTFFDQHEPRDSHAD